MAQLFLCGPRSISMYRSKSKQWLNVQIRVSYNLTQSAGIRGCIGRLLAIYMPRGHNVGYHNTRMRNHSTNSIIIALFLCARGIVYLAASTY